jgi:exonuclease SbcD
MGFRFIHAADIHLDSPLKGLSAYENAPAEQLRNASRDAFKELVSTAISEKVSFMVIAGDLYDGDWRDYNTGIFFAGQMGRLDRERIPVFVLHGNHDAESEMTKKLVLPENVTVFPSNSSHVHKLDQYKVALHGQSFPSRAVDHNLAAAYKPPVKDFYNIGVLHTALEGYAEHPTYAPCTVNELHAKGYEYWALGHVHEFQRWDGASTIVFPGNLQGRHVRETGRKGAVSVTVDDGGHSTVDRLYLDVLRWEVLKVDVTECQTFEDVIRKVGRELVGLLQADDIPRAVRVVLEGNTKLHGALVGNATRLRAQVLAQAAAVAPERLWVEKVKVATSDASQQKACGDAGEAIAELRSIFDEAKDDPDFLRHLQLELQPFINKVPDEVGHEVPLIELAKQERFADLIQQVAPSLIAKLKAGVA